MLCDYHVHTIYSDDSVYKMEDVIKDEANVNKFNFKKEFCGIGFIMFMVYWIISCVDAIAY